MANLQGTNPYAQGDAYSANRSARLQAQSRNFAQQAQAWQQASAKRRQALDTQNQQFRDREYALVNQATGNLVQANTNSKVTDLQLQQVGQQMKQEYYDAVKVYQNSDKGDESRQAFEQAKEKALGSARTINGAIEKLTQQTTAFEQAYQQGGISDAMDPKVRLFMQDLIDPKTPKDAYQIITDEETGKLKYIDSQTGGQDVSFFLEDVANGENQFLPTPKVDMPKYLMGLTKGLKADMTQSRRDDGAVVSKTNWNALETQLDARLDADFQDMNKFKAIAAGEGFGWDAFNAVENGEVWSDEDGNEFSTLEDIQNEVKMDLKKKLDTVLPHEEKVLFDPNAGATPLEDAKNQQAQELALQSSEQFEQAVSSGDSSAFNAYLGKSAVVNGFKGNIASVNVKGNKAELVVRTGKNGEKKEYDLSNMEDLALFQSTVTGQDYNLIKQANINSLLIQ